MISRKQQALNSQGAQPIKTERLADELVELLRRSRGDVSLRILGKRLSNSTSDIDEASICNALDQLRSWGYKIESRPNGAIRFGGAPDRLLAAEIKNRLGTKILGSKIHAFQKVSSTNTVATQLANAGAAEGEIVIAESQTGGRGRLGRAWHSPIRVGAYLSIILRPAIEPVQAPVISILTALALAEAIERVCEIDASIKWPNDVFVSGKKVSGILTELITEVENGRFVIVGTGININQTRNDFPESLKKTATSLRISARRKIDRILMVQEFLRRFEKRYLQLLSEGFSGLRKQILKRSILIGKTVKVRGVNVPDYQGQALDIDELGRLMVETASGVVALNSGDVTLSPARKSRR
ncbi:MAG: biotin--[acetyl-CoA-carboxylase] ligase [candidate division Zixibacteria bacterium]|nr:biotin--[acetyl-CoA-carboxylase] ligase [candidate division Zixibacteria bacterium]